MTDSRDELRKERLNAETAAAQQERRRRLTKLLGAAIGAAALIVVVAIVVSQSGGSDSTDSKTAPKGLLTGIPQHGTVLGDPAARVTVIEYGDLQCPFCQQYSTTVVPDVINGPIRSGDAKIEFKNWVIIGPQSVPAAAASLAAAEQNRYWQFIEDFYANQGEENSGYVTDAFLLKIAQDAGVPDIAKWQKDRKNPKFEVTRKSVNAEAEKLGFSGTPSFAVVGPKGTDALGTPKSAEAIKQAVSQAQ